jgi:hypothetical protein
MAYISCHYDPQAADPTAGIDYAEFEQAILEQVSMLTDLSPERHADLDDRLRDMRRCFWGALPKVQAEIIKRSIPFIDVPRGPSMTLLEMYDRGKAARDAAR